ncbi:PEP-CTERM sorting domain-containing protein [Anatilimnocola sp. NA78]|uniref:PEP-CTERM sorting domain-containing protein n=1 Tax=Anatilimnocola sp. NA78 TaxID=3415683 RepID=UPI003CE52B04
MRFVRCALACLAVLGTVVLGAVAESSAAIYVIDTGVTSFSASPKSQLTGLGYTVNSGGALANYSGYEQVWDLRYNANLSGTDTTAMEAYLQSGGRMYLTGEHNGFDASRNNSLLGFLNATGAGPVSLVANTNFSGTQTFTTEGQALNSPTTLAGVNFFAGRVVSETGQGFLVTQTGLVPGQGSLLAWDFGDITGKESARMIVGFDHEMFGSTPGGLVGNFASFLGATTVAPEPATLVMWSLGMAGIGVVGWRRRRKAHAL